MFCNVSMINGEFFAKRTVAVLNPYVGRLEDKSFGGDIRRISDKIVNIQGIHFGFYTEKKQFEKTFLDVVVEPLADKKDFDKHIENIQTRNFWNQEGLEHLKKQKNKYTKYLENLKIELNGEGNYHFKGILNTNNDDKAFYAVMNRIIRPVWLYLDERFKP